MGKKFDLLTMGEIMLRLSPPRHERMSRGEVFEKGAGGSELNVASGVSLLGRRTGIITKLPDNEMGTYVKNSVRATGVTDKYVLYDSSPEARLGVYYYESGFYPRKPSVVYDRRFSSMNTISIDELPEDMYEQTEIFHTSGITLALSENTRKTALEVIRKFKQNGARISFDVNFRANLWTEQKARAVIEEILPLIDIFFVSEETCRRMFRKTGTLQEMQKSFCDEYPISIVASTERKVISPRKHNFTSTIYSAEKMQYYREDPYVNIEVIDRIGSGDAYVSGVLFGLLNYEEPEKALEFGNAAGAVKNTIPGDLPVSDFKEISRIIASHKNTGEESEMNR